VEVFFELLYRAIAAWRYLFSRSYRERVHARWRSRSAIYAVVDIICALTSSVLLLLFLCVVGGLLTGRHWWL
jgi:hypothetical protein